MNKTVFDDIARDYEKIHNQSLPPGVSSDDFVQQKAEKVIAWIKAEYRDREFCYLDFGCGNGRLFKYIVDSDLGPLIAAKQVRLYGFDTSGESLKEAARIAGEENVCLVSDPKDFPPDVRFDLAVSFNVFHHIVPAERPETARTLQHLLKPQAKIVVWEHNPFNPLTRIVVGFCPFDEEAILVPLHAAKSLFAGASYRLVRYEYVNIFPPRWHRFRILTAIEARLATLPLGTQYWVMFENR